jgi:hypothetical protein
MLLYSKFQYSNKKDITLMILKITDPALSQQASACATAGLGRCPGRIKGWPVMTAAHWQVERH